MTLRLILLRHAKSSWDDPRQSDHDRPLNARGRRAADNIGGWLADRRLVPDTVLSSDSARTRETWERVAARLSAPPTARFLPGLYHATAEGMLSVLHTAQGRTVMMIGHNPGIGEFAMRLLARPAAHPDFARYPTCATLVAEIAAPDWAGVSFGTGRAEEFVVPRELDTR